MFVRNCWSITFLPQFCLPIMVSYLSWGLFDFLGLSSQFHSSLKLCVWSNIFNDLVSLKFPTTSLRINRNPFFCNHLCFLALNSLLIIARNILLFRFVLIKTKLINLVDQVLCLISADHFKLVNLIAQDLCLLYPEQFNVKIYLGSLRHLIEGTPIKRESQHFNLGCYLFIDPWRSPIEKSPLNLQDSRQHLPL